MDTGRSGSAAPSSADDDDSDGRESLVHSPEIEGLATGSVLRPASPLLPMGLSPRIMSIEEVDETPALPADPGNSHAWRTTAIQSPGDTHRLANAAQVPQIVAALRAVAAQTANLSGMYLIETTDCTVNHDPGRTEPPPPPPRLLPWPGCAAPGMHVCTPIAGIEYTLTFGVTFANTGAAERAPTIPAWCGMTRADGGILQIPVALVQDPANRRRYTYTTHACAWPSGDFAYGLLPRYSGATPVVAIVSARAQPRPSANTAEAPRGVSPSLTMHNTTGVIQALWRGENTQPLFDQLQIPAVVRSLRASATPSGVGAIESTTFELYRLSPHGPRRDTCPPPIPYAGATSPGVHVGLAGVSTAYRLTFGVVLAGVEEEEAPATMPAWFIVLEVGKGAWPSTVVLSRDASNSRRYTYTTNHRMSEPCDVVYGLLPQDAGNIPVLGVVCTRKVTTIAKARDTAARPRTEDAPETPARRVATAIAPPAMRPHTTVQERARQIATRIVDPGKREESAAKLRAAPRDQPYSPACAIYDYGNVLLWKAVDKAFGTESRGPDTRQFQVELTAVSDAAQPLVPLHSVTDPRYRLSVAHTDPTHRYTVQVRVIWTPGPDEQQMPPSVDARLAVVIFRSSRPIEKQAVTVTLGRADRSRRYVGAGAIPCAIDGADAIPCIAMIHDVRITTGPSDRPHAPISQLVLFR